MLLSEEHRENRIRSNHRTCPNKRTAKQFRSFSDNSLCTLIDLFIKAYVVGTQ